MILEAHTIAGLARGAGFVGRPVHVVTAIAVAGSGGLTHYHQRAGIPGAGDWRGLYAMNVDELEELRDVDLFDPYVATKVAHDLTHDREGFDWSGVYRAGTWARHEPGVSVEASKVMKPVSASDPVPQFAADLLAARGHRRLAEVRERIVADSRRRAVSWPRTMS